VNHNNAKYRVLVFAPSLVRNGLIGLLANDHHYKVITADTPSEAVRLAAAAPLDLILVDDDGSISIPDLVIKAKGVDAEAPILVFREKPPSRADDRLWTLGIDDCLVNPITPAKFLHHVARALKQRRLGVRCEELSKDNQELYRLSITDGLTRLINKRHFMERLQSEFSRAKRFGGRIGLVICDIDHFKLVNDSYGHLVGDRILRGLSKIIGATVRSIDTAGRYGGEEFVLMLPETALAGVVNLAEKVRCAVEAYDFTPECADLPGPAHITISLGCASYPEANVERPEELLELADKGLYLAKKSGRNRSAAVG